MFFVMISSVTWTGEFEYWYCYNEEFSDKHWTAWIFMVFCNEQFSDMDWRVFNIDFFL